MNEKFLSPYKPDETEPRVYKFWEESGYFNPENCIKDGHTKEDAEPYTIMMPPPNVTGVLHMGHALMLTIEDILVRFERMRGKRTLWLPGTDHAAIATQARVEKDISKKEGKSRYDLGREELLARIAKFAEESHATIVEQVKTVGASCDWSREAFTFDEPRSLAVRTMFKRMYDDGLIYRGNRIVNWDPKGQTTISDDEIVYVDRTAKLYTFKYWKEFPVAISTTRPETKVGDTAVAVHPSDERYKEFVGKTFEGNFCGVPLSIKIIADESVEKEFGTGALGVTPAHSGIDWAIADRHDLPRPQVIDERAKMMVGDERLLGKKVGEARETIVEWLRTEGLLEKEEDTAQSVATAERTGGIVEPLPKLQWFVAVNKPFVISHSDIPGIESGSSTTLKELMRKAVSSGSITILPDHFGKIYFHWIDNLQDWCISRQIWYGHRVPVWYKDSEIVAGTEAPVGDGWEQDPDTLDTWFSSGLWTFSTLGWPEKTKDLEIYHPTNVLETGYEILFFWVARMILMSGYALGTIPFKTVYLHGTVRDAKGNKMSKSLGNGIDPIDVAKKFGADAGRMALIVGNTPGTDTRIWEDKIKAYKHFANKIWNIVRFILSTTEEVLEKPELMPDDKELLAELEKLSDGVTKDIENYRLHLASEKLYQYVWHTLADVIIERSKEILKEKGTPNSLSRSFTLRAILNTLLKLLHPFMPFVTEEIWQLLPQYNGKEPLLMVAKWPSKIA